jgi:serine/threonine protein kinase/WD40 repeat protein
MPETPSLLKAAVGAAATPSADIWYLRLRSALRADKSTLNNFAETTDDLLATPPLMTRVGDYELIESIGRGGMGIVYRARQIKLQRDVAVKMLPSQMSRSAAAMQRLIEEARRLAHVKHTNIVQVHDVGFQDGVPFFSMELIEGRTLADMIRKSSIDVRRAAALTRTIAEAVQAAHDADVIHRDLKPSNILLTNNEEPKVTDFGLAITHDEAISRGHCEAAGTAEYMAPEQWAGDAELIGARTDVYGLGGILYELLTGRPPFPRECDADKTRLRVMYESPAAPRSLRPQVPRDLEAICLCCLEKSPDRRYASAKALAADLNRFLNGYPVVPRPVGFVRRMAYTWRRNWTLLSVAMLFAIGATIAISFGLSWLHERRIREANTVFDAGERAATAGRISEGIAQMRQAIDLLPANQTDLGRYFGQSAARWQMLEPIEIASLPPQMANITAAGVSPTGNHVMFGDVTGGVFLWSPNVSLRTLQMGSSTSNRVQTIAFNCSGTRCAAGFADSTARIWEVNSGRQVTECRVDGRPIREIVAIALLGDGNRFVTGSFRKSDPVRVWSAETVPAKLIARGDPRINTMVRSFVASPDGKTFVATGDDGRCWLCDDSGRLLDDLAVTTGSPTAVAYASDSSTLAVAGSEISVFDIRQKKTVCRSPPMPGRSPKHVVFRPDGGVSCVLEGGPQSVVRQMTSELDSWDDIPLESSGASVHPGTKGDTFLLTTRDANVLRLWRLPPFARRSVRAGDPSTVAGVSASGNGRHVLVMSNAGNLGENEPRHWEVSIWDRIALRKVASTTMLPDDRAPYAIAQSPVSGRIAVGCESVHGANGAVLIGEPTADGALSLQTLGLHTSDVCAVVFSTDGQYVFSCGVIKAGKGARAEIVRWDVGSRTATGRFTFPSLLATLAISPDGKWIAAGAADGTVLVLTAENLSDAAAIRFPAGAIVSALAFSSDGHWLVCGTSEGRVFVLRFDKNGLVPVRELPGPSARVRALRFSRNSQTLYVGTSARDNGIAGWNAQLGRQVGPSFPQPGVLVDFDIAAGSPAIIALTSDGRVTSIPISDDP